MLAVDPYSAGWAATRETRRLLASALARHSTRPRLSAARARRRPWATADNTGFR